MASSHKTISSLALFLCLNLLFFSLVAARGSSIQPVSGPSPIVDVNGLSSGNLTHDDEPSCPRNSLQIDVCVGVLDGLVGIIIGEPSVTPCCNLVAGLVDLEAAVCLCTAIKASVLGIINVNLNLNLRTLLNYCKIDAPASYKCA